MVVVVVGKNITFLYFWVKRAAAAVCVRIRSEFICSYDYYISRGCIFPLVYSAKKLLQIDGL